MDEFDREQQEIEQQKDERRAERDANKKRIKSLRWIMSQAQGRNWMWHLLGLCNENHLSFTGDNNHTNFNEGARNVGLQVKNEILEYADEHYWEMVKENTVKPKKRETSET